MTTVVRATWNDRNQRFESFGKDIRLSGGARIEQRSPSIFDHFLGGAGAINSANPQVWVTTETGAGASKAIFVPVISANDGGWITGVAGATSGNAEEVSGKNICWTPSTMATNKPMTVAVRAKVVGSTTAADGDFFIGWADVSTATSGRAYTVATNSTATTGLTEGAMLGYSSLATSGALFAATGNNYIGIFSTKATVAATPIATSSAATGTAVVKDSAFHIYRVDLDSAANASFFVDDIYVGGVAAATTAATSLTPYVGIVGQNSHANTGNLDWIYVGADFV